MRRKVIRPLFRSYYISLSCLRIKLILLLTC
nr:MAG TPA: hypothetical protein [Caudoviricetes sp.]